MRAFFRALIRRRRLDDVRQDDRQAPGLRLADELRQDLRYAARTLLNSPGFTTAAALTLALGIGAVTIIYSVVHNVVLDPLPYRDAHRLVNVFVEDTRTGFVRGTFGAPEFLELRERSTAFEGVIGTLGQGMRYDAGEAVEFVRAVWVTPNFFEFMGLAPLFGRTIMPADAAPGAPAVAVLRHRAWVAFFAADPGVIGRTVLLDGTPRTIVGVMPPRFTWHAADLWLPGPIEPAAAGAPLVRNFQARLRPGVTLEQAAAELNVIASARAARHPKDYPEVFRVRVVNVIEYTVGPFSGVLYTALAAVGLLMLIACCNVANMLLARATAREREMSIRVALGAGRVRILRQLTIESVLLAAAGAAGGCLLAYLGIGALVARLPQGPLPGEVDIALNAPVLLVTLAVSVLSAMLFGMAPALYAVRRDLVEGLKASGKGIASGRGRLRIALVVLEIALALVLVLSAGLLMRSFVSVIRVDPGFRTDDLLLVSLAFPPGRYTTPVERQRFYEDALRRIASIPGVSAAAATTTLPPFDAGAETALELPDSPAAGLTTAVQLCTAGYFRTLGVQVTRGVVFSDVTLDEKPRVAVVNETFARQYFAGRDPRGRQIRLMPPTGPADPARHGVFDIAAVVKDVRNKGLRERTEPQVYLPWSGASRGYPLVLVRTAAPPATLVGTIRRAVAAIDRQVVVVQPRTVTETLDRSFYAQPRFSLLVLGIFAVAATLLVGVGVFSVMAYTVARQRQEIAVRMALGATRGRVCRVILRSGARLLAIGALAGLLASLAANRLLASQLWEVSPHDPVTVAGAVAVLAAIALLACYIPARRAMRVDPSGVLRQD